MRKINAISYFLPNSLFSTRKFGFIPDKILNDTYEENREFFDESPHGESLLYKSKANLLICFDQGLGERAMNFALTSDNCHSIIVTFSQSQKKIIQAIIDCKEFKNVDCVIAEELIDFLSNKFDKELIGAIYASPDFFDLEIIKEISKLMIIDLIIGGYDDALYPTEKLYQELKGYTNSFRLFSSPRWNVIHWDNAHEIDLSVIVPCYNIENYISQCLDSVCLIENINYEILVIDDGSSDKSAEIVSSYSKKYPQIKLISQVNGGCAAARQKGLEIARGTYVGFLDGDDWVDSVMFKKLFDMAIKTNSDVSMCGYTEEYSEIKSSVPVNETYRTAEKIIADCYVVAPDEVILNPPTIWRKIYNRSFLLRNNIKFDKKIKRFDDLLFNAEVFLSKPYTVLTSGDYYHYRLQRPGQTVGFKDERLFVHFDIFNSLRKKVKAIGNEKTERLFKTIQIGTHYWVDTLFDEGSLKRKYREKVKEDLFENTNLLSSKDIFSIAKFLGKEKESFVKEIFKEKIIA
jgi:glycosyltransferase involved in cell wall biosynthesis